MPRARTRELPGHFPFIVQESFIKSITGQWRQPALDFSQAVHGSILYHAKKLVKKHFSQFGQGHLEHHVKYVSSYSVISTQLTMYRFIFSNWISRTIMLQHIEKCKRQAEDKIAWLLKLEDRPFSLNTHYLTSYRDKFLAYYRGERQRYDGSSLASALAKTGQGLLSCGKANPSQAPGVAKALAALAEIGIVNLQSQDLMKLLPPDDMEPALIIMADVRAYFQGLSIQDSYVLVFSCSRSCSRLQTLHRCCSTRHRYRTCSRGRERRFKNLTRTTWNQWPART